MVANAEGAAGLGLAGSLLLVGVVWVVCRLPNAPNPAAGLMDPPNADEVEGAGGGDGRDPNIPGLLDVEGLSLLSPKPKERPPNEGTESDIDASRDISGGEAGEGALVVAADGVELAEGVPNPKPVFPNAFVVLEAPLKAPKAPVDEPPPNAPLVGVPNAPDEPLNAELPPPNVDGAAGLLANADVG